MTARCNLHASCWRAVCWGPALWPSAGGGGLFLFFLRVSRGYREASSSRGLLLLLGCCRVFAGGSAGYCRVFARSSHGLCMENSAWSSSRGLCAVFCSPWGCAEGSTSPLWLEQVDGVRRGPRRRFGTTSNPADPFLPSSSWRRRRRHSRNRRHPRWRPPPRRSRHRLRAVAPGLRLPRHPPSRP